VSQITERQWLFALRSARDPLISLFALLTILISNRWR